MENITENDDEEDIDTKSEKTTTNPPIRAIFANRHPMNDNEHLAWTISCNYQRTMHPIFIHHINRIEEAKRKQRQFIYNTLNNLCTDGVVDVASTNTAVRGRTEYHSSNNHVSVSATTQQSNSVMKFISPKATAVHISILKIQSKN